MDDVMTSAKAAWHLGHIARLRSGRDVVPLHVQLILSDLCNQDCHFCAYRMEGGFSTEHFADENGNRNPNRMIPTSKALEIVGDCIDVGVKAIEFTGGGEPTVHKDWKRIVESAQINGLENGLVTNGVRLEPCDAVANLTWLRVSLDAGTAETYQRIRKSSAWSKALKAIEWAAKSGPLMGVGFVITRENYKELAEATTLVRDLGAAYIRISAMFSASGAEYYHGLEPEIDEERARAKELEDDRFRVIDFFGNRIEDLRQHAPDYSFCGEQQFVSYIGGDQKVYTCCTNAYTTHGEIGDLRSQSFKHWLENTRRYDFDARTCHDCQFNDKNRLINFLIQKKPGHVNFV